MAGSRGSSLFDTTALRYHAVPGCVPLRREWVTPKLGYQELGYNGYSPTCLFFFLVTLSSQFLLGKSAGVKLLCYKVYYMCVCVCVCVCVRPCVCVSHTRTHAYPVAQLCLSTPWAVAHQAPLSMGFPRQEYWSGVPFLPPGDLPDSGIKPMSPALAGGFFTSEPPGKPQTNCMDYS